MAITFSSFLMKLFLLPTERNNYFGSVSKCMSVVCQPKRRWCVGDVSTDALVGRILNLYRFLEVRHAELKAFTGFDNTSRMHKIHKHLFTMVACDFSIAAFILILLGSSARGLIITGIDSSSCFLTVIITSHTKKKAKRSCKC